MEERRVVRRIGTLGSAQLEEKALMSDAHKLAQGMWTSLTYTVNIAIKLWQKLAELNRKGRTVILNLDDLE